MSLPAILARAVVPLLLIAGPLVLLLVRRARRVRERLAAELAVEPPLRGPEKALYRGGSGSFSKVKGNGTIVLTRRRLLK